MYLIVLLLIASVGLMRGDPININNAALNEKYAKMILENSRKNFKCGFPKIGEKGIPPLDPLLIPKFNVYQRSMGVNVVSNLTNVHMRGLERFVIKKFSFRPDKTVEYIFETSRMTMDGSHVTRGTMASIPVVNGQGQMTSEMINSRYHGFIKWSTMSGSGYIYPVKHEVSVNIQKMTMRMTGFGVLTNAVNNQIEKSIPELLASKEFQNQMNEMLGGIIMPMFSALSYKQTVNTITNHLAKMANTPQPKRC